MRTSLALLVGLCAATPVAAQDSVFQPVDRIAAIVGDIPIPLSRVDEELNLYLGELQRAGQPLPQDSAEMRTLRRQLIDRLIDDELLVQQARRDTMVKVTDAQVQSATDAAVRQTRGQFSSDFEFRRQLQLAGLGSPEEYRRYIAEQVRRDLVKQAFIQQKRERGDIRQLPPTDDEMRTYFEASKAQWPKRPATVSFRAVVIRPEATAAAKAEAQRRADSVLTALRAGADFATAARRFSDDPGSRDDGGDLGWFRRGRMVREFEAAAFRLRPGQISNVVESPFGFHLIQVERVEPAEVKARHILFAPKLSDENLAAAQARADSVVQALRAGVPLDSLLRVYHDPLEQSLFEDVVPADLPEPLQNAVQGALPGDVMGPVQVNEADRARFLAIRFDGARPEGEYTFEELRDRIRARLAEDSGVRRYLQELRSATYIDIRL